jgi:hypothetical protein
MPQREHFHPVIANAIVEVIADSGEMQPPYTSCLRVLDRHSDAWL